MQSYRCPFNNLVFLKPFLGLKLFSSDNSQSFSSNQCRNFQVIFAETNLSLIRQSFVNRSFPSLHVGSLDTTLTDPLNGLFTFLNHICKTKSTNIKEVARFLKSFMFSKLEYRDCLLFILWKVHKWVLFYRYCCKLDIAI